MHVDRQRQHAGPVAATTGAFQRGRGLGESKELAELQSRLAERAGRAVAATFAGDEQGGRPARGDRNGRTRSGGAGEHRGPAAVAA